MSLAGVAACGPAGESGGAGAGAGTQSKGPVTLRVNYRTEKYFPVRAQQFTDANPNVKVDMVADIGYEKLVALLVAGDLGDIIWASTGVGTYFELAGQGHFLQLDSVVAKDKYDLKQHFPRAIDTAKTVDGKLFGLPSLIHVSHIGLWYNAQLFDKAGVAPPTSDWTYDQLAEAARKLTTGQTPEGRPAQWGLQTETAYRPCSASSAPSEGRCSIRATWGRRWPSTGPRRSRPCSTSTTCATGTGCTPSPGWTRWP